MKLLTLSAAALLTATAIHAAQLDIPDGRDFVIADVFSPALHLTTAVGGSSEDLGDLALGAHDPNRDGLTLQGLELDLSIRANEYLEGFLAWNLSWGGENEDWVEEFEEAFGKVTSLPGGFEVRGGRMLNRFGIRNVRHLHSWNTVDQSLVNARFLGEEGLSHEGADLTWYMPTPFTSALTLSYGEARAHDHGHGGDEHDDHGHNEAAEGIGFEDEFVSGNLLIQANRDDFNQFAFGGSVAAGDNGLGDESVIYALNLSYTWRENGLEPGGRHFIWNTEAMLRDFDAAAVHDHEDEHEEDHEEDHGEEHEDEHAHEEDHEEDEHDEEHHEEEADLHGDHEFGFYTEGIYAPAEWIEAGLRIGYVAGIKELDIEERFRVSPLATFYLSKQRNLLIRLQYNYDDLEHGEDAHSAWAQLQYSFGGREVR